MFISFGRQPNGGEVEGTMKPLLITIGLLMCSTTVCAIEVDINAELSGRNCSDLIVTTNLPEKTTGDIYFFNTSLGYNEHIESEVSAGRFVAIGPASNAALEPGNYVLEVSIGPVQFQPASVQSVIGNRGEMLQGGLVRRGMLGKTVLFRTEIQVE